MKVLVYSGKTSVVGGIQTASTAQIKALNLVGVETTIDPTDSYDIVDINYIGGDSLKILKAAKKRGIPVVAHAHSNEADYKYSFRCWPLVAKLWFYPTMWKVYKNADFIIPVSNFCKHNIEAELLHNHMPIQVINNAVDLEYFIKDDIAIDAFYKYFNLKPTDKIVIGIGLPVNRKGIKDFIAVAKQMPDTKFIWFGGFTKLFMQSDVLKAIKYKPDNVIMPGYLRNDVLRGALQAANCLFFPTYCENDSIVALEALASKIPFLVRDIGAMEYLQDGVTCFKGKTNEEFVEKLKYMLNNDCSKVTNAGYKYITDNRSLECIGKQLKMAYEEILKTKNEKH